MAPYKMVKASAMKGYKNFKTYPLKGPTIKSLAKQVKTLKNETRLTRMTGLAPFSSVTLTANTSNIQSLGFDTLFNNGDKIKKMYLRCRWQSVAAGAGMNQCRLLIIRDYDADNGTAISSSQILNTETPISRYATSSATNRVLPTGSKINDLEIKNDSELVYRYEILYDKYFTLQDIYPKDMVFPVKLNFYGKRQDEDRIAYYVLAISDAATRISLEGNITLTRLE